MTATKTQYRVSFKSFDLVSGNMVEKEFSTRWYDSIEEAKKWMGETSAKIITREYTKPSPPAGFFSK